MGPLLALLLFQTPPVALPVAPQASPVVLADLQAHARSLEDLSSFRASVGDATVIGLGEATHGSREIFETKARLFRDLVENKGWTVLALEADVSGCLALDRYVLTGEGDPKAALAAQGFWTWNTQEHLELIRWMRAYNADPAHAKKLRVVGVDIQNHDGVQILMMAMEKDAGLSEDRERTDVQINLAEYFPTPERTAALAKLVDRDLPTIEAKLGSERARLYARLATALVAGSRVTFSPQIVQRQLATVRGDLPKMTELATSLLGEARSLSEDGRWALERLATLATNEGQAASVTDDPARYRRGAETLRKAGEGDGGNVDARYIRAAELALCVGMLHEFRSRVHERDEAMADNVDWIGRTYLPGAKVAFWGHDLHVRKRSGPDFARTTGHFLAQRLGDRYYALGFSFGEGAFQSNDRDGKLKEHRVGPAPAETIDGALTTLGRDAFVPIGGLAAATMEWSAKFGPGKREIGANYVPARPDGYFERLPHLQLYDGLVFLRKVSRARPL